MTERDKCQMRHPEKLLQVSRSGGWMALNKSKSQSWLHIRITREKSPMPRAEPTISRGGFQTSVSIVKHPWKTPLCSQIKTPEQGLYSGCFTEVLGLDWEMISRISGGDRFGGWHSKQTKPQKAQTPVGKCASPCLGGLE